MKKWKCLFLIGIVLLLMLVSCKRKSNSTIEPIDEPTYFSIVFDTQGGSPIESQLIKEGDIVKKPENPTKEGFVFNRWLNEGKEYNFYTAVKSNLTLTAEWEKANYSLELKCNKVNAVNLIGDGIYNFKDEVTISAEINPGYTFIGWYEGDNELSKDESYTFEMPSKSITYEVRVVARTDIPYKVEYYLQNVENDEYTLYETDTYYGIVDDSITPLVKEYDEYISPDSTTCVINGDGSTIVRYKYDKKKYNITLKCNNKVIDTKKYKIGEKVTIIDPKCNGIGYVFDGWYEEGNLISSDDNYSFKMPSHNVEFDIVYNLDDAIKLFEFNSTQSTCTITGIKDKTLTSILVPNYVTNINKGAFAGCKSIENINLPFIGGSRTSNGYLGYIFGAGSATQNSSYVPSSLKNVTISDGCMSIEGLAFYRCSSLTNIEMPISLLSIGDRAFGGCNGLTNIIIPASIKNVSSGSFDDCSNLTNVYYDGNINEWCNIEFSSSSSNPMSYAKKFYLLDNKGETEYQGNKYTLLEELIIPQSIEKIGNYQFIGFKKLKSIEIASNVTSIGTSTFAGCNGLTSVTITKSVTSIGSAAFNSCNSLASVYYNGNINDWSNIDFAELYSNPMVYATKFYLLDNKGEIEYQGNKYTLLEELIIPNGLSNVGIQFYGINRLKIITIPKSVTYIGLWIFENCSNLTNVYYKGNINEWCNIEFSSSTSNPMVYATNFYILDENGKIEYQSEKYSLLDELEIPKSIDKINNYQFQGFNQVKSINIPSSVTSIGRSAFEDCNNLESITIPFVGGSKTSNGYFGYIFGASKYSNNSSYVPSSLKEVIILDGCMSIEELAFYYCKYITSITIPSSVTSIGKGSLEGCSILEKLVIPKLGKLSYLFVSEDTNFAYSYIPSSLKEVIILEGCTAIVTEAFHGCSGLESITIPSSVVSIGSKAFWDCNKLTSITIPENVKIIDDLAFWNCSNLSNVTIFSDVIDISFNAFSGCTSLHHNTYDNGLYLGNETNPYLVLVKAKNTDIISCVINDETKNITGGAFDDCSSITNIIIPSSVILIGEDAFSGCSSLTTIDIPTSVTSIGYHAFSGCSSLESITIPSSVTSIGSSAFYNCSGLTSITIPSSVTNIGSSAFSNCNKLKNVYYNGEINDWCDIIFGSSGSSHQSNPMVYASNFFLLDNDGEIEYQGNRYKLLENLIIPDSVKKIGDYQFYGFSQLKILYISSSVTSIGTLAFYNCSGLQSIIVDDCNLFYNSNDNCNAIIETSTNKLILGCAKTFILDGVTSIESNAFLGCDTLTNIVIPDSVTKIYSKAFYNCSGLTKVYYYGTSSDWNKISISSDNTDIINAKKYYYSGIEPIDSDNYWHYVNGVATEW